MTERALVLGSGQDASYCADLLLERGAEVHLLHRRSSSPDHLWRIAHLIGGGGTPSRPRLGRLTLHEGDVLDAVSVGRVIAGVRPGWILNCADQDNVAYSKLCPGYTFDVTCSAVVRMLEAVRQTDRTIRWFQPLSTTMFGEAPPPQSESTPLDPQSPYACAKAACWHACKYYRRAHGMFVACAILMNHTSPRQAPGYLLQTIARGAAAIARGEQESLALGNLDTCVDVGYAKEYMEAAIRMLELPAPDDFLIATGRSYSVGGLARLALASAGVPDAPVVRSKEHYREAPPPPLEGDIRKAAGAFGFAPREDAASLVGVLVGHFMGRKPA
jgi:GDPmannose 4,6-dehydratase